MRLHLVPALFSALVLAACGPNGASLGDGTLIHGTPIPSGYGRLSVGLTSSAGPGKGASANGASRGKSYPLQQAMIVVDKVTAHSSSAGWVTLRGSVQVTVDVLRLGESAVELGFADLPAGKVTQIRLHVDPSHPPYVVTPEGTRVPLKVPSGSQSGLKVKGTWDVQDCDNTQVTLDLDKHKAIWIHPTGHEELYILRPVIKAGGTISGGECAPPDGMNPGDDPNDPNDGEPGDGDPNDSDDPPDTSGTPDPGTGGDPGSDPGGMTPGTGDPSGGDPSGSGDPGTTPGTGDPSGSDPTGSDPTGGSDPGTGDPTGGDPTGGSPGDGSTGTPDPGVPPGGACTASAQCTIDAVCSNTGVCIQL